jgi:hypothetical protein
MSKFAVINYDSVINTIVAESQEIAETITGKTCIAIPDNLLVNPGFLYNTETNTFTDPFATEEDNA